MSVRMRSTSGKGGSRRSHHSLKKTTLVKEGDVFRLRHRASRKTGLYKSNVIESIKNNLTKKNTKIEERAKKEKENQAEQSNETANIPNVTQ